MNWFIGAILDWIVNRILGLLKTLQAKEELKTDIERQAAEDSKKAKAITPESSAKEVDDAIDDELRRF